MIKMPYNDILEKIREYYDLEGLWSRAQEVVRVQ